LSVTDPDQSPVDPAAGSAAPAENSEPQPVGEQHVGQHEASPPPTRHLNRGASALIGTLLALLGFALAIQLRSNSSADALAGDREEDLVTILDDQNSRIERLQDQLSSLQTAKQRLADTGSGSEAAQQEAQRQADALAVLTGTVAAHGPGIIVTISDPDHKLKAEDLLDVIEELRGAGSEVIQFGSVRVSTATALSDHAGAVFADGVALQEPYRVLAIGDPATMNTALNIVGGVVSSVRLVGATITIEQKTVVSITALRPISQPRYAIPVPK
jgi:uncharacterized protein YlxW (UPF0749 family)